MDMELPGPGGEFVSFHQARLKSIGIAVDGVIYMADERTTVTSMGAGEVYFLEGEATPSEMMFVDQDDAEELANSYNTSTLTQAQLETIDLVTMTSMYRYVEQYNDDPASARKMIYPYESTVWQRATFSDDSGNEMTIKRLELKGIASYPSAVRHEISINSSGLLERFVIVSINDQIVAVDKTVAITEDPMIQRISEIFGGYIPGQLLEAYIDIGSGAFEDEQDLEVKIYDIWKQFEGMSSELEVSLLLEEIRSIGRAAKDNLEFSAMHSSNLPTADDLERYLALVT